MEEKTESGETEGRRRRKVEVYPLTRAVSYS